MRLPRIKFKDLMSVYHGYGKVVRNQFSIPLSFLRTSFGMHEITMAYAQSIINPSALDELDAKRVVASYSLFKKFSLSMLMSYHSVLLGMLSPTGTLIRSSLDSVIKMEFINLSSDDHLVRKICNLDEMFDNMKNDDVDLNTRVKKSTYTPVSSLIEKMYSESKRDEFRNIYGILNGFTHADIEMVDTVDENLCPCNMLIRYQVELAVEGLAAFLEIGRYYPKLLYGVAVSYSEYIEKRRLAINHP